MKKQISMILASVLVLASGVARADLVANGGFETGDFTGWTLTGNPGFIGIIGDAHSGAFAAGFGAVGSPTFLSQTLTTTPGTAYKISYWLENLGGPANAFNVEWNGSTVILQTDLLPFPYTQGTVNVVGTGSDELTFSFQQNPSFFHIDDVSVSDDVSASIARVVPEPASLALLGGALLAFVLRRRARSA